MDKKKPWTALACLCLSTSVTGCSVFLEDSYSAVSLHTVAPVAEDASYIGVESYYELVNALAYYVTAQNETGQIRFVNYNKEQAKSDMNVAVAEVMNETAMGSYGVESIQWDINSIMGNMEGDITIEYHKTPEELEGILLVSGTSAIVRGVSHGLSEMLDAVTVKTTWASSDRSQIPDILQRAYESSAAYLVEIPTVHTSFYPKEGSWRILELEFYYNLSLEQRVERVAELEEALYQITSPLWSQKDEDFPLRLLQTLSAEVSLSTDGDTPYHVLVAGEGTYRGISLAYLALCQEMALSCQVVEGSLDGVEHHWNLVTLADGSSIHVDASRGDKEPCYYYDNEMEALGYEWKKSSYATALAPLAELEV